MSCCSANGRELDICSAYRELMRAPSASRERFPLSSFSTLQMQQNLKTGSKHFYQLIPYLEAHGSMRVHATIMSSFRSYSQLEAFPCVVQVMLLLLSFS
jgi:hypothetical protein